MDQRAAVPVSLPAASPTQSCWQDPPDDIADLRTSDALPAAAEFVVVGSGITGAAVAWNLLQHGERDVVMLEARQACSGATGRNGGHTKAASYRTFTRHAHEYGAGVAVQIARLELENIRAVHAFAREHGIPCESNPCDTIDVVYDPVQWERDRLAVQAMRHAMPDHPAARYTFHTPQEVRDKFFCGRGGDEGVCGGITYEAGSISGYKFGVGVLKLCLERGLNLQTNTPAAGLEKQPEGRWKVNTPRGSIVARKVVLATNGYTAALLKRFQGLIVPTRGHVTAQRPGRSMPSDGLRTTYSFIYPGGYEYMIPRPAGSPFAGEIVVGGGLVKAPENGMMEFGTTNDAEVDHVIRRWLHECLPRYFGDNWGGDDAQGRVRKEWTGIMGYSVDGLPFVGEVPGEENLWMSCSFQGHGMVLCWMCAKAVVADMVGNRDHDALASWFPAVFRVTPERMALAFKERVGF